MKQFTAEYRRYGSTGTSICCANTIGELIGELYFRNYEFESKEIPRILEWSKTDKKRFYGTRLTINRGEYEMTEYTSF